MYANKKRLLLQKVGLQNNGNRCDVNSTIQSFYMLPELRHAIITLQSRYPQSDEKFKSNFSFLLKKFFINMQVNIV